LERSKTARADFLEEYLQENLEGLVGNILSKEYHRVKRATLKEDACNKNRPNTSKIIIIITRGLYH